MPWPPYLILPPSLPYSSLPTLPYANLTHSTLPYTYPHHTHPPSLTLSPSLPYSSLSYPTFLILNPSSHTPSSHTLPLLTPSLLSLPHPPIHPSSPPLTQGFTAGRAVLYALISDASAVVKLPDDFTKGILLIKRMTLSDTPVGGCVRARVLSYPIYLCLFYLMLSYPI